jgi:hypothetical protein
MMNLPWRLRLMLLRERMDDYLKRPICWVRGHPPIRKMGLRNGALCGRCYKFLKD